MGGRTARGIDLESSLQELASSSSGEMTPAWENRTWYKWLGYCQLSGNGVRRVTLALTKRGRAVICLMRFLTLTWFHSRSEKSGFVGYKQKFWNCDSDLLQRRPLYCGSFLGSWRDMVKRWSSWDTQRTSRFLVFRFVHGRFLWIEVCEGVGHRERENTERQTEGQKDKQTQTQRHT